jgi:molybdopterin-containing oxidoreductase family membrane subunit
MNQQAAIDDTTLDDIAVEDRAQLVTERASWHEITEAVARPVEGKASRGWYVVFGISLSLLAFFAVSLSWLLWEGVGVWGNNVPVAWGFPIVNFVFWVGIGHAGTLISAILFLFRQRWRTSINRAAEAMTLFAVMCALVFPGVHTGRPWLGYWLMPIPNQMNLWPQFRSPLMWDVFAVSIYGTVSAIFWYLGLIPDLATMRDRAKSRPRRLAYGFFALGWRNSARHWTHYESAYLLIAGLATPLVLSVHSVVSFDFAVSQVPGWHGTILPPYFVAGAIFSGMAMVVTLMLICRVVFGLEHLITMLHFDRMARLLLLTSIMVAYSYAVELYTAWYSGNPYEIFAFANRAFGHYAWAYVLMLLGNVLLPHVFWFKRARQSIPILFAVSIFVNVGMWMERFVIVVVSLHRDFMPSSWRNYAPTLWDITTLAGSFGLFFTMFCLFVRYLPMVAMSEVKGVVPEGSTGSTSAGPAPVVSVPAGCAGLLAEFATGERLASAAETLRDSGYTAFDAHSPVPLHGLRERMGLRRSPIPWFVLVFAMTGAGGGMLLQWWTSGVAYPLIVAGKPYFSWPAYIPITFECAILGGVIGALVGFLATTRLPRHHHALFSSARFEQASDDRFFLSVASSDHQFDPAVTSRLLQMAGATRIEAVPE